MFEAARFGDEISHTSALGGFLIGAALGIALVATVAIATFTCGFGVALLAGLAICQWMTRSRSGCAPPWMC